jgi:diguanylate cyclase (GGDEF)-like protein
LAVLFLDLDKFKPVNDTYGHTVGDHLLQDVARRLTRFVRESDTVGRIGGDEFIILLEGIKENEDAAIVAGKILATLSEPYNLATVTLQIIPSIGVAVYPENGENANELILYADNAMYQIKKGRQKSVSR